MVEIQENYVTWTLLKSKSTHVDTTWVRVWVLDMSIWWKLNQNVLQIGVSVSLPLKKRSRGFHVAWQEKTETHPHTKQGDKIRKMSAISYHP